MVIYLERGADGLHMVQLMPLHPQTLSSFASFKSRLFLPFWYLPTRVFLEKRSLNGCSSNRLAGLWFDSQEHLMQKYLRSDTLHALCPFFQTSPGTQFANILQFIIRIKFVVRSTYDCDLRCAKISFTNVVSQFMNTISDNFSILQVNRT